MIGRAEVVRRLRAAGCVWAEDEADLILREGGDVEALVAQRVSGAPLEVVLGWAELAGVRVHLDAGVFVPRRRSELLVDLAREEASRFASPVVVDLCCGSGAVGAAVVSGLPAATLVAADVDAVAVACARRNVEPLGGTAYLGDLYAALPVSVVADVLVVNAPYVPSDEVGLLPREARDHEPRTALDGGADGAELHRRVAAGAPARLSADGVLLVETSAAQAELTVAAFESAGLVATVVHDDDLDATVALGRHPSRPRM
ncbi:MAG TPA: putative protein N(5)-glutamine methyltransferase [Candidatus Nanopelagicales bacterium]|nr:putative protein N(5)-glutamine methyltransferase [Candidatus Nanopelagicales bacterium]